jgi:hypothetical protein
VPVSITRKNEKKNERKEQNIAREEGTVPVVDRDRSSNLSYEG